MATLEQARIELSGAREQIRQERQRIAEYKGSLNKLSLPRRSLSYQLANKELMQSGRVEQTAREIKSNISKGEIEASRAAESISKYEKEVLEPYEREIQTEEARQSEYNSDIEAYNQAYAWYSSGMQTDPYYLRSNPKALSYALEFAKRDNAYVESQRPGLNYTPANFSPVSSAIPRQELFTPTVPFTPANFSPISNSPKRLPEKSLLFSIREKGLGLFSGVKSEVAKYIRGGLRFGFEASGGIARLQLNETYQNELNKRAEQLGTPSEAAAFTVTSASLLAPTAISTKVASILSSSKIEKVIQPVEKISYSEKRKTAKELLFGFGGAAASSAIVGSSLTGAGLIAKTLAPMAKNPILKSTLDTGGKAVEFGTSVYFQTKFIGQGADTITQLKRGEYEASKLSAAELSGGIVGAFGSTYGTKKAYDFGLDRIRTLGYNEVPSKQIIAPEYFEGQNYPAIKPGQTAGQLRKEFFTPIKGIGETKEAARMFTSSPRPFARKTKAEAGSSEVRGLYGSPKLSPLFLGGGEKIGFIGDSVFPSPNQPTALRTSLSGVEFAPGVKPNQRKLRKYDYNLRQFFGEGEEISKAKKGTAYIPFIKTEKEAVLTYGSGIKVFDKKFFFKFNKRRVPIFEALTESEYVRINKLSKSKPSKSITLEEYYKRYYPKKSPLSMISPTASAYNLISRRYVSGSLSTLKNNRVFGYSSKSMPSYVSLKSITSKSKTSYNKSKPSYYRQHISSIASYLSKRYSNLYGVSYSSPYSTPAMQKRKFSRRLEMIGRASIKKFSEEGYIPSFSALVLKITSKKKPQKLRGGYLPGFRPIIR